MLRILIIFFVSLVSICTLANDEEKQKKIEAELFSHLKSTTDVYSKETGLYAKFKRTQTLSLLEETDTAKGELHYSKKRLRLDLNGIDKSMVLVTPTEIWNVSYEEGKPKNIVKSKPVPMPLLDLLFGDRDVWDKFQIIDIHTNTDSRMDVTLKPKKDSKISYVAKVRFNLDKKKNIVRKLTYWDDVDNETELTFTYSKFKNKMDESLFKFTPPQGANVSEM